MTDNVTNFPTRQEPMMWVCNCGCSTFHLQSDGLTRCANCDFVSEHEGGVWFDNLDGAVVKSQGITPRADVQGDGSVEFARRRIERLAKGDDVVAVVVIRYEGAKHIWTKCETAAQVDWLHDAVGEALGLVVARGEQE